MDDEAAIIRVLRAQAGACREMGSPLTGELFDRSADDWLAGGPTAALLAPWRDLGARELFREAVVLRLAAALHDLALSAEDPPLAEAYAGGDIAAIWPLARAAMIERGERLARFMGHEPQTNEVRRSAVLLGGFLEAANATGLPLRMFEIGASAGLNQLWDSYRYELGEVAACGPADAPLVLETEWRGPAPAVDARVEVISRAACDRRPTDLADPEQRRRLLAYIWADQTDRFARIETAIGMALARRIHVDEADAVEWTRARVSPERGATTVLYHSVSWQYMPAQSQAALAAEIERIGTEARPDAPFAWVRMEPSLKDLATMEILLTLWPGGETRTLGLAHPHGAWVEWQT